MLNRIIQNVNPHRVIRHEGVGMKTMCCGCHAFLSGDPFAVTISHGYCKSCVERLYPEIFCEEDFTNVRDEYRKKIERRILEAA